MNEAAAAKLKRHHQKEVEATPNGLHVCGYVIHVGDERIGVINYERYGTMTFYDIQLTGSCRNNWAEEIDPRNMKDLRNRINEMKRVKTEILDELEKEIKGSERWLEILKRVKGTWERVE